MLHELTLRGLVLANPVVPYFVIRYKGLPLTDSLLIVLCIIPIEMLVIGLVFKFYGIAINFYRLLIAVSLANIATSIIGIPFLYNYYIESNSNNLDFYSRNYHFLVKFLIGNFLIAWLVESLIYQSFLKQENLSFVKIVKAAFASNLLSYLMFALVMLPSYNENNSYNKFNLTSAVQMIDIVNGYLKFQEEFYVKNNQFASNWDDIKYINEMSKVYPISLQYEIQSNKTSTTITATPQTGYTLSARGTIFFLGGKDKFIKNICITDLPSMIPPEMPKLVNGGLQCPSGSRDWDRKLE